MPQGPGGAGRSDETRVSPSRPPAGPSGLPREPWPRRGTRATARSIPDRGRPAPAGPGGRPEGPVDPQIAGATAEVAGQGHAEVRERCAPGKCRQGHDHARRADAALGPALGDKASARRRGQGRARSPSIVVTRLPATCATGTRHAFTGTSSTRTVQAPHWPSPHPSFVPVSPHSSRRHVQKARHRVRPTPTRSPVQQ